MLLVRLLCRLHDGLSDLGYAVGTAGLAAMAGVYCYEVVLRYFLGIATSWVNDTFSNLMIVTVFAMVPHATRLGQHISINLLPDLVPALRRPLRVTVAALGVAVCLLMAWMSFDENLRHIALGIRTEQNHPIPKVWMSAWMTFGFLGAALYFLRGPIPGRAVRPVSWITPGRGQLQQG